MSNLEPLPYGKQTITSDDIEAVKQVLQSPFLTQGPVLPVFEQALSNYTQSRHSVAVNSATSALHIACLALGLKPGDRIWTSPITFVASANCGRYCGAKVEFVDINPNTALLDVDLLKKKLIAADRDGVLPKVIIPVHLTGTSCDMALIGELADLFGVHIIEDASHAIGSYYMDMPVGNCRFSSISVFSFHPVKIITTAEGGLATTNDPILADRMYRLRSHGIERNPDKFELQSPGPWYYEQHDLGFNYRLTELQAALGLSQLKRLDLIVDERNKLLDNYKLLLNDLPITFLEIPSSCRSSVHLAVILLDSKNPLDHRRVFEGLRSARIGVQLHYSPVHLQPYYQSLGWKMDDFPSAESYASRAISLPLFPGLTDDDQQRVADSLRTLL